MCVCVCVCVYVCVAGGARGGHLGGDPAFEGSHGDMESVVCLIRGHTDSLSEAFKTPQ